MISGVESRRMPRRQILVDEREMKETSVLQKDINSVLGTNRKTFDVALSEFEIKRIIKTVKDRLSQFSLLCYRG